MIACAPLLPSLHLDSRHIFFCIMRSIKLRAVIPSKYYVEGIPMKIIKRFVWLRSVAAVTMVSVLLLGCASDGSMNRTQKGAAIGGVSGAAVGGFVGQYMDKQAKELEQVAETERVDDGIIVTMKDKILFDFNS